MSDLEDELIAAMSRLRRQALDEVNPRVPADVLDRVARRRRRRIAAVAGSATAVVAVLVVLLVVVVSGSPDSARLRRPQPAGTVSGSPSQLGPTTTGPQPITPGSLAFGAGGTLYLADTGREQVLALSPSGHFRVVAGDGQKGFAGDGGPAVDAELNTPYCVVAGPRGAIYICDTDNNRVREVTPNGTIRTVVGNGRPGFVTSGTSALAAAVGEPDDVALDGMGRLIVASFEDSEVVRLASDGRLTDVLGSRTMGGRSGEGGPAVDASADAPSGVAVSGTGDIYVFGFATKTLLVVSPSGIVTTGHGHVGRRAFSLYPRSPGGLTTAPDGTVYAGDDQGAATLQPDGVHRLFGLTDPLPSSVETLTVDGIAVAPDGTIDVDTDGDAGFGQRSAILEISPPYTHPRVRWAGVPSASAAGSG